MSGLKAVFLLFIFLPNTVSITLNSGGYENIYIVIQDTIPENLELLDRIQEVFTNSSQLLFVATKYQTYFGKIKIVIPKSWSSQGQYQQLPALSVLKTFITIDTGVVSTPHVRSRTYACGEEGWYMYLTPAFLLETGVTNWGKHENVIVHEWGHLRWGLFDEYQDRYRRPSNFYMDGGEWKPVSCSAKLQGTVGQGATCSTTLAQRFCNTKDTRKTMRSTCYFCPDQDQSFNISLMGFQYIDALTMFCDKNDESVNEEQRHNDQAPNTQNLFCSSRSAWEVMREHEDFRTNTYTLPSDFDTTPEFEFIQETDGYRVFVLDVSGSMSTNDRIGTLQQSAEYIIQEVIPFGSWLAIVTFSTYAATTKSLTRVNSQTDRDLLKQALPTVASGSTCIGCGIEKAVEILSEELGSAENGEIILITDGENNVGTLADSKEVAVDAKVVIHTVAVSQQADTTLSDIATETGGKHFTYLETGTVSFASVLSATVAEGLTSTASQSATMISETTYSSSSNPVNVDFSLEEGLGGNTTITVLTQHSDDIHIQLYGPNNYTQNMSVSGTSATMKIPDIAQAGSYNVKITVQQYQSVEYYVTSYPTTSNNSVIRVVSRLESSNVDYSTGTLPVMFVDVSKSYGPVLNATVNATVESNNNNCILNLYDNGMDPDKFKDDGTYSGYVWGHCLSTGRVNIKVYACGNGGETLLLYGTSGSTSPNADESETEVIDDSFQRVVVTEELFISNYNSETTDVTAPGRITDVEINNIETEFTAVNENRNFTITWTATGDDKSSGQASIYEMKISDSSSTLRDNFDTAEFLNMTNGTIVPQVAGETEALKLVVDAEESYTDNMYFAVRAIDESGNIGPVSNIVPIVVANGFRISGEQGYAVVEDDVVYTDDISPFTASDEDDNISSIIIGVSVTGTVLLIIVVVIAIYLKKYAASKAVVADSELSQGIDSESRTSVVPFSKDPPELVFSSSKLPSTSSSQVFQRPTSAFIHTVRESQPLNSANLPGQGTNLKADRTENHSKAKEEASVDIEDYFDEFEEPDTYIRENMKSSYLPSLPFHMTNKAGTIAQEAVEETDTIVVVNKDEKEKVLSHIPKLPFEYNENSDRSHPPPNMALHIIQPENYGFGKKTYAFPSPFSGVTGPFSLPDTSNDEVEIDEDNDVKSIDTAEETVTDEEDDVISGTAENRSYYSDDESSITSTCDKQTASVSSSGIQSNGLDMTASTKEAESTFGSDNNLEQPINETPDSEVIGEILSD